MEDSCLSSSERNLFQIVLISERHKKKLGMAKGEDRPGVALIDGCSSISEVKETNTIFLLTILSFKVFYPDLESPRA